VGNLRKLFVAAPVAARVDLTGRKIVVTGATPGSIGFQTAKTFAAWGASVVVTARSNPQAAVNAITTALSSAKVSAHALDLSSAESVARFTDWYAATQGERLDVLVNNAGIHLDLLSQWKQPRLSADGYEIQWRTNYLGTAHLTYRLLPLLQRTAQASGEARIVNVVSELHTKGSNAGLFEAPSPYNSWTAYGLSKLALVHASFELQRRHAAAGVQTYCLHPGAVFTDIASKGLAGNPRLEAMRKAMAPLEAWLLLTPEEGAQTQIHCATQPGLAGGLYYRKCKPARASAHADDATVSARLWDDTIAWIRTLG